MPQIGTSGSMSGEGKRGAKLPRLSSTLPGFSSGLQRRSPNTVHLGNR